MTILRRRMAGQHSRYGSGAEAQHCTQRLPIRQQIRKEFPSLEELPSQGVDQYKDVDLAPWQAIELGQSLRFRHRGRPLRLRGTDHLLRRSPISFRVSNARSAVPGGWRWQAADAATLWSPSGTGDSL